MARFVAVLALVLTACSGDPGDLGFPERAPSSATGGASGTIPEHLAGAPAVSGGAGAEPVVGTGGVVETETGGSTATGGATVALCRWSCLSVTRWTGVAEPVTATTSTDGVDCGSPPADQCTQAAGAAIHSVCAVGDAAPNETTDCQPPPDLGTGGGAGQGTGSQSATGWSCHYAAFDAAGATIDEVTLPGDCGDPCDVMVARVCDLWGLPDCGTCDRDDITCTFDGESMATDFNGLGLRASCVML